jgi:hypothetical protein
LLPGCCYESVEETQVGDEGEKEGSGATVQVHKKYDYTNSFTSVVVNDHSQVTSAAVVVVKLVQKNIILEVIWFATMKEAKGLGLGRFHFRKLQQLGTVLGASAMLCLSSNHATAWWLSLGFRSDQIGEDSSAKGEAEKLQAPPTKQIEEVEEKLEQFSPQSLDGFWGNEQPKQVEEKQPCTCNANPVATATADTTNSNSSSSFSGEIPVALAVLRASSQPSLLEEVVANNFEGREKYQALHQRIVEKLTCYLESANHNSESSKGSRHAAFQVLDAPPSYLRPFYSAAGNMSKQKEFLGLPYRYGVHQSNHVWFPLAREAVLCDIQQALCRTGPMAFASSGGNAEQDAGLVEQLNQLCLFESIPSQKRIKKMLKNTHGYVQV